jgi:hypothetical protein
MFVFDENNTAISTREGSIVHFIYFYIHILPKVLTLLNNFHCIGGSLKILEKKREALVKLKTGTDNVQMFDFMDGASQL